MALFTKEELAAMAAADEEIDREFQLTNEELRASRARDRAAVLAAMEPEKRKTAEANRAYREANRDKIAEAGRAYRAANRDKIAETNRAYRAANRDKIAETKRAYYEANRDKILEAKRAYYEANLLMRIAYAREYQRKRRSANAVTGGGTQ